MGLSRSQNRASIELRVRVLLPHPIYGHTKTITHSAVLFFAIFFFFITTTVIQNLSDFRKTLQNFRFRTLLQNYSLGKLYRIHSLEPLYRITLLKKLVRKILQKNSVEAFYGVLFPVVHFYFRARSPFIAPANRILCMVFLPLYLRLLYTDSIE